MDRDRVTRALELIDGDLAGDLRVERLARASGVSPFHFHRMFRAAVGESPKQYVRRLRLEQAAFRLQRLRHSVTDAAFGVGYESHEAFTRAFKARFGVAPSRFRAPELAIERPARGELWIETLPARRVACVRHVGPYDDIWRPLARLRTWAERRGVEGGESLGMYRDDQGITAAARTRCLVALVVAEGVTGEGEVEIRVLPGGDYAVFAHDGPPRERRALYDRAYRSWLPALGRRPSNRPPIETDPESLATRVYIPLSARSIAP